MAVFLLDFFADLSSTLAMLPSPRVRRNVPLRAMTVARWAVLPTARRRGRTLRGGQDCPPRETPQPPRETPQPPRETPQPLRETLAAAAAWR